MRCPRRHVLACALVALGLAACAGARTDTRPRAAAFERAETGAASLVVGPSDDALVAARRIAALARSADVVYLGEQHDNPAHHAHQRAILDAIVASGGRPAIGFEMLEEDQQAAVDQALAQGVERGELAERLRWAVRGWPDFDLYWPLFEIALRVALPVIALDLDPAVSRRIARDGVASLGARTGALASLLPADGAREEAIAGTIRDGHCGLLPEARLPTMVEAWHARNVTMARRLAAALDKRRPVVVIVGRGHQGAGGLPAQLAALRPGTRQLVVDMIEVPAGARRAAAAGTGRDVVWLTPPVDRGDPCAGLRPALR